MGGGGGGRGGVCVCVCVCVCYMRLCLCLCEGRWGDGGCARLCAYVCSVCLVVRCLPEPLCGVLQLIPLAAIISTACAGAFGFMGYALATKPDVRYVFLSLIYSYIL